VLDTKVFNTATDYVFSVTDGADTYEYSFAKEVSEGQDLTTYLQNCKREAELLAQLEIDQKVSPQEIII